MIDLLIENGDLVLNSEQQFETTQAISQRVYITFAVWLGDWFFDETFGVNYTDFKASSQEAADLKIKAKLLSVPGVVSITRFESTYKPLNRFYEFTVRYTTTDSPQNILTRRV